MKMLSDCFLTDIAGGMGGGSITGVGTVVIAGSEIWGPVNVKSNITLSMVSLNLTTTNNNCCCKPAKPVCAPKPCKPACKR